MGVKVKKKEIFNITSKEEYRKARMINGNPNGIINKEESPHQWAAKLYEDMRKRTWFTSQIDKTKDIVNYGLLPRAYKRSYDLILAQLIADDSIQVNQLMDSFNKYITSPIVNLVLSLQSTEEGVHVDSYSVMARYIIKDIERIYSLHTRDKELMIKNKAVQEMYDSVYNPENGEPTAEDILMAAGGNQILEELVFPGGFAGMLLMEEYMPGSAEFIKEIMKDETLSHVEIFKNIFRTIIEEEFDGKVPNSVKVRLTKMIKKMADAEKRWSKYALRDIRGASDTAIDYLVEEQANSVCKNLWIPTIYEKHRHNPLKKLLQNNLKGYGLKSRTAFFERNVADYSKGSLIMDY